MGYAEGIGIQSEQDGEESRPEFSEAESDKGGSSVSLGLSAGEVGMEIGTGIKRSEPQEGQAFWGAFGRANGLTEAQRELLELGTQQAPCQAAGP